MRSNFFKITKYTVATALLMTFGYWQSFSAPVGTATAAPFRIAPGDSVRLIAENLENKGLIRSSFMFSLYAKARGLENKIRPGKFPLSSAMNAREILLIVTNPKNAEVKLTVPEGFSVFDIDERLTEMGLIEKGEFPKIAISDEGYLFPDTYFVFTTDFRSEDLIKKMKENFASKITPEIADGIEKSRRTLKDIVIMASIIEKEVRTPADAPIIAGILWKRMDAGWPLQADATLLYGRSMRTISASDLESESPYNTRNKRGLPPTAIGNPGIAALGAAVSPESSPYWFYLTDPGGKVHYAVSNEEHNENRKKYLQ